MGWEHHQTVDPFEEEPQVFRGLLGVRLLILHFNFQFSKSIKSSTFHIFLSLTYPLRKKSHSQNFQKFTQNRKTLMNVLSGGIWQCLKCEQDVREVKFDVYGKRQTAKIKLLPSVFSSLYSRIEMCVCSE